MIFPGCDIYKPRKPKGLSTLVLEEWKKQYPESEETNKTIGFKLAKYDRGPESERVKISATGRIFWSPQMLQKLQETRIMAQNLSAKTGISLTKAWKEEWRRAYPNLNVDWRTVLSRYNYHFGNLDTISNQLKEDSSSDNNSKDSTAFENGNNKVKGFRNWTSGMEQDLIETRDKVLGQGLEKGSSEFNRMLLRQFQTLYPKCMESSRSLYSKLQSIEKDELKSIMSSPVRNYEKTYEKIQTIPENKIKKEVSEEQPISDSSSKESVKENVEVKKETFEEYPPSKIEGFEDWNLPMIRDFIACMDTARKKYAALKEQDMEGQFKIVPLLLEEWRILHPETSETVRTFLVKIKHLKTQKEIIKKDLGAVGLLPRSLSISGPSQGMYQALCFGSSAEAWFQNQNKFFLTIFAKYFYIY